MKLRNLLLILTLSTVPSQVNAAEAILSWDPVTHPGLDGYKLLIDPENDCSTQFTPTREVSVDASTTTVTVESLDCVKTCFTVVAMAGGQVSPFSNLVNGYPTVEAADGPLAGGTRDWCWTEIPVGSPLNLQRDDVQTAPSGE